MIAVTTDEIEGVQITSVAGLVRGTAAWIRTSRFPLKLGLQEASMGDVALKVVLRTVYFLIVSALLLLPAIVLLSLLFGRD